MMWAVAMALATLQDEAPDLVANTPKVLSINARRKERAALLVPHLDAARIGDARDGRLGVRSEEGLSVKEKAALRKLVEEENADRDRLLKELARVNEKVPEDDVRLRWVAARRKAAARGWWLQNDRGDWKRKKADKGALEADFNQKQ
jgi:uncharacterized protein YdbL (DUF1318 family)